MAGRLGRVSKRGTSENGPQQLVALPFGSLGLHEMLPAGSSLLEIVFAGPKSKELMANHRT